MLVEDQTESGREGVEFRTQTFREFNHFDIGTDYFEIVRDAGEGNAVYFINGTNVGPWQYEFSDIDRTLPRFVNFRIYRNGVEDQFLRDRV